MALQGARDGWNGFHGSFMAPDPIKKYDENWSLYTGEALSGLMQRNPYANDHEVYRNSRLIWKHVEAIADFYAGVVYQGALAAEPPESGNDMGGAIPFVAQVGDDTKNAALLKACVELFIGWNWQSQMSMRPLYASILGDCLTELVDDLDRRFVYPQIVWPGYVVDIELDYVDNVKSYVLKYPVEIKDGTTVDRFILRKEVDKESFRYFRDDKGTPVDVTGNGAVIPNPYGFVPAIWDRHRQGKPDDVRGRSAIDGTKRALLEVNSVFSHAIDFQRKTFFAPMMVTGKTGDGRKKDAEVDTTSQERSDYAESLRFVMVPPGSDLLQPQFDIGKTREMLDDIQKNILAENPEAAFYQQIRNMAQVTAPGIERAYGDVKNRVDLVRAGMDSNTVKQFQMAIAICGYRASDGSWNGRHEGRNDALTARQMAFLGFGLDSYKRGDLDMSIAQRPIVPMTESEEIAIIQAKERLLTGWAMEQAGIESTTAQSILSDRNSQRWQSMNGGSYADYLGTSE